VRAAESAGFDLMAQGKDRKYFMVGGKGGVGKTSLSSSLAVKFATAGHHTLLVSTDPAHSLSDSLAQDVGSGLPVAVEGTDGMLYAMEVDPEQAKAEFASFAKQADVSAGAKDFMSSVGLGGLADQLGDLKLGELLDTPPPGLDEAIAIAKVVQFIKDDEYAKFTRIVFDTAPTGHTLRLLSLPDFLDASIGKIVRLRQKLTSAGDAVKSLFGVGDDQQDEAIVKLEALKQQLQEVKDLFRNEDTTEFVIVTIPTVLGISESGRLLAELRKEKVPASRLVVNQIINVTGDGFKERREELAAKETALREALGAIDGADLGSTRRHAGRSGGSVEGCADGGELLHGQGEGSAAGDGDAGDGRGLEDAEEDRGAAVRHGDQGRARAAVHGRAGLDGLMFNNSEKHFVYCRFGMSSRARQSVRPRACG
jgi:arsenite-transporting ATPase